MSVLTVYVEGGGIYWRVSGSWCLTLNFGIMLVYEKYVFDSDYEMGVTEAEHWDLPSPGS